MISRHFIAFLLAAASLIWNGHAQLSEPSSLWVYPDSETSSNPRVPCIPPIATDSGMIMNVEAVFDYTLAPFVQFGEGGTLTARVRGSLLHKSREVFSLISGDTKLVFRVNGGSKEKPATLAFLRGGKEVASASGRRLTTSWTDFRLVWNENEAIVTTGDGDNIVLPLSKSFDPQSVSIQVMDVSDLRIHGQGTFALDWRDGYAARVEPRSGSDAAVMRLFGFDTYVISLDPDKRDFPMLEVLNGTDSPLNQTIEFSLKSENSQMQSQWIQKVEVPARSSAMIPVTFPTPLKTDVYHMEARSSEQPVLLSAAKHFIYVESRPEKGDASKFGLHDSARWTFGFWPDALPIGLAHVYVSWGPVQGMNGLNKDTPPEGWNWNRKVDWAIEQGLTPYVCVQSIPFFPWMREHEFAPPARMRKYPFGDAGGMPKLDLYRIFLKNLMERYKGRVNLYEVENEPNSNMGGTPPEAYVRIAQAVWEVAHEVDSKNRVFGICGTGDFMGWTKKVFALGGASWMDGISIHTYASPRLPESAGLPGRLAELQELIASTGKPMPVINSETGTYVALREEVDRPISPSRLAELIEQGVLPFTVPKGWPNYALDEQTAGSSVVQNAVLNFLGGVESFTFFAWNDKSPKRLDWWDKPEVPFAMISASKDGQRTPSLYTLAIGVLTEQLKSARLATANPVGQAGLSGGVFDKEDGGQVAVLWSPQGKRSVLVETGDPSVEVVSLFGQKREVALSKSEDRNLFRIELSGEPVYIHVRQSGIKFLPSPVLNVVEQMAQGQTVGFQFRLVNKGKEPWQGSVKFPEGWKFVPASQEFSLAPGEHTMIKVACEAPKNLARGSYPLEASLNLPGDIPFTFPLVAKVRPTLTVPTVPDQFAWDQPDSWKNVGTPLKLDQVEQVFIGRPPLLSSLQEEKFWKGSDELSGEIRIASNKDALFIWIKARDANFQTPANWPSVVGSSVELFLDTRPASTTLGEPAYTKGVRQFLLKPVRTPEEKVLVSEHTARLAAPVENISSAGAGLPDHDYWIALRIPWASLGVNGANGLTFGFDIALNGASSDGKSRKSQMVLFGTASNSIDASGFGMATLPLEPSKSTAP